MPMITMLHKKSVVMSDEFFYINCGVMGPNHTIGFWALTKSMNSESEEEYLLGEAKRKSGIDPNDQSDFPESSSDRDMCHKRTKKMGIQKYLRESCYHPRRLLEGADGTSISINHQLSTCRVKMKERCSINEDREPREEEEEEKRDRESVVAISTTLITIVIQYILEESSSDCARDKLSWFIFI